ncbi:MAG: twin-arginine translocase TatA/TatE family subunit [Gemmatimonadota bacterium]
MPFGLGPTELIVILLIVLLVFGAKRLPEIGASLGKGIREFKSSVSEIQADVAKATEPERREVQPNQVRPSVAPPAASEPVRPAEPQAAEPTSPEADA